MEFVPSLKRNLALVGVVAGGLALGGCSDYRPDRYYYDYKGGTWGNNSFDYPNSQSDNRIHAKCEGKTLKIKAVKGSGIFGYENDQEKLHFTDPACKDEQLTKSDDFEEQFDEVARLELDWGYGGSNE